jgi:hypothetical protein
MTLEDIMESWPISVCIPDSEPLVIEIEPELTEDERLAARRGVDRIMAKIRGAA